MNEKQKVQSQIAELVKLIQFERNRPTLTVPQLEALKEALANALEGLKQA